MKEECYSGTWWLPNEKNNAINGILTFKSNDNVELELMGSIKKPTTILNTTDYKELIILGLTAEGEIFTLYDCYRIKETFSNGFIPIKYSSSNFHI